MTWPRFPRAASRVVLAVAALGAAEAIPSEPRIAPDDAHYVKGADLVLLQEVRDIARRVERIVGRRLANVVAVRATDDELDREAARRGFSSEARARLESRGRAWADIGLGEQTAPAALAKALASDLPGIGLDVAGRRLLVGPGILSSSLEPGEGLEQEATVLLATGVRPEETLVVHVLVHLLQSRREEAPAPETTDGTLARAAWDEGEAGLVAILYLFEGMGLGGEVLEGRLDPAEVLGGRLLPDWRDAPSTQTRNLLDFVYREGFFRAAATARVGGMEALQSASRRRPTTRDLLHPDRPRIEGRRPRQPEGPPAPAALRIADRDEIGEQGIVVLVSTLTGKDNLALAAADGWVGDELVRWEPASPAPAPSARTEWVTDWATEKDAEEFEYAWARCVEARFGGSESLLSPAGAAVRMETPGRLFEWSRQGREVRVRILAGPASENSRLSSEN